jgi:hypothetical protein
MASCLVRPDWRKEPDRKPTTANNIFKANMSWLTIPASKQGKVKHVISLVLQVRVVVSPLYKSQQLGLWQLLAKQCLLSMTSLHNMRCQ